MEILRKFSLIFAMSTLCLIPNVQADTDKSVSYKNQRGSTMTLTWHNTDKNVGTLSGTFISTVGNCKEDVGTPLPLNGIFNGNAVAVTVNFPHCALVVAMSGNFSGDELHMLWLDATQVTDLSGKDWNSNIIGADYYKKQN